MHGSALNNKSLLFTMSLGQQKIKKTTEINKLEEMCWAI